MLNLYPGESIRAFLPGPIAALRHDAQAAAADCDQCIAVPFRVVIIESQGGRQRTVSLCGRHFIEALKDLGPSERNFAE